MKLQLTDDIYGNNQVFKNLKFYFIIGYAVSPYLPYSNEDVNSYFNWQLSTKYCITTGSIAVFLSLVQGGGVNGGDEWGGWRVGGGGGRGGRSFHKTNAPHYWALISLEYINQPDN